MNIALVGHRGTGKTTVCRLLARKLDKKLVSADEEIARQAGLSMEKFVKKRGWEKFYEVESDVMERISDLDECVFDTCCSIIMRNENIMNLKKNSLVVALTCDPETIAGRTGKSGLFDEIRNMLRERGQKYVQDADYIIDTSKLSPEEVCNLIGYYLQAELQ